MSNVIYESVRGLSAVAIEDAFLRSRKIFLTGGVNDTSCNELLKELLFLESEDASRPIILFINSPGGDVDSGLAVYDTIRMLRSPVTTVCVGIAASMAAIIYLASDRRLMLPNSKIMIHDPCFGGSMPGGLKPHEIQTQLDHLTGTKDRLCSIIAERTGKPLDEVKQITMSDSYYDAPESIRFGLAHEIVESLGFMEEAV